SPLVLSAQAPAAGALDAGVVTNASGPTLLPPGLLSAVAGGPPHSQAVKLAGFQALRYGPLQLKGASGSTTIYVAPLADGVVTIACMGMSGGFAADCDRVAASATLVGLTPLPLGPDPAYARALSGVLAQLHSALAAPLAALAAARTHTAQAA